MTPSRIEDERQLLTYHWSAPPYHVGDTMPEPYRLVTVAGGVAYWDGHAWHSLAQTPWPGREITWPVRYWLPLYQRSTYQGVLGNPPGVDPAVLGNPPGI